MTVSTTNATPPEIHRVQKPKFLGTNSNQSPVSFGLCTARYRKIWFLDFGGFGGVAISVETVIQCCRSTKSLLLRDLPYGCTLLRIAGHGIEFYSYLDGLEVSHRNPHAHINTRVSTCTHTRTHTLTHAYMYTHTHIHTHAKNGVPEDRQGFTFGWKGERDRPQCI